MAPPAQTRRKPPSPASRLVRTLGTLTLLYGLGLLLYAALSAAMVAGFPFLAEALGQLQEQQNAQQASRRASALAQLKEQEEQAATPAEKAGYRVDQIVMENTRQMGMPMTGAGLGVLSPPRVRAFVWAQTLAILALALPLAVAGLGLMARKEWARKLALADSALMVPVIIGFTLASIFWLTPLIADAWIADIEKLLASMYGEAPRAAGLDREWSGYGSAIGRMMAVLMGLYGVLGLVYPIVLLCVLRRPGIAAECAKRPLS